MTLDLPTNENALAILNHLGTQRSLFEANKLSVTMWWEKDTVVRYIGYFNTAVSTNQYRVDHLARKNPNNNVYWIHEENPAMLS